MNGAQIKSMQEIVLAVGNKEMPAETAVIMLTLSFPTLEEADIRKMVTPMEAFEPKPKPAALPFGGGAQPQPGRVPPQLAGGGRQPGGLKPEDLTDSIAADAKPAPLYVYRKVKNPKDILAWARTQGFKLLEPAFGDACHVALFA